MEAQLSDKNLLAELNKSRIAVKDKRELASYIPSMAQEDRMELMTLIEKGERIENGIKNGIREQNATLLAKAKGAETEMAHVVSNAQRDAGKQIENLTAEDEKKNLQNLEGQINNF